jgi:hypothetical protein
MINLVERRVNMQQRTFEWQNRMEDDILNLARLVSESIVAAATCVAEAIVEAVTILS